MKTTENLKIFQKLQSRPPEIGRTVYYGVDGIARAAIIVDVDHLSLAGKVSLTVFLPGKPSLSVDAKYSRTLRNGFWSWP
jgi:hypothetical protein